MIIIFIIVIRTRIMVMTIKSTHNFESRKNGFMDKKMKFRGW